MNKKIDVAHLAHEIIDGVDESYLAYLRDGVEEMKKSGDADKFYDVMMTALRLYTQRFTISLIQRVVDELQSQEQDQEVES